MTTVLLIHGGLWEDMDAGRFWHRPGIVAGLESDGFRVLAPDRIRHTPSWADEARHLAAGLPDHPVTVVAGSNGCSVAVRLALAPPGRVERLLLAWPATAGDPAVDARTRTGLIELGAGSEVIDRLLTGPTLRGIGDEELTGLAGPVGVLPSVSGNAFHQRRTVDDLLRLVPQAVELPGAAASGFPTARGVVHPDRDRICQDVAIRIRALPPNMSTSAPATNAMLRFSWRPATAGSVPTMPRTASTSAARTSGMPPMSSSPTDPGVLPRTTSRVTITAGSTPKNTTASPAYHRNDRIASVMSRW